MSDNPYAQGNNPFSGGNDKMAPEGGDSNTPMGMPPAAPTTTKPRQMPGGDGGAPPMGGDSGGTPVSGTEMSHGKGGGGVVAYIRQTNPHLPDTEVVRLALRVNAAFSVNPLSHGMSGNGGGGGVTQHPDMNTKGDLNDPSNPWSPMHPQHPNHVEVPLMEQGKGQYDFNNRSNPNSPLNPNHPLAKHYLKGKENADLGVQIGREVKDMGKQWLRNKVTPSGRHSAGLDAMASFYELAYSDNNALHSMPTSRPAAPVTSPGQGQEEGGDKGHMPGIPKLPKMPKLPGGGAAAPAAAGAGEAAAGAGVAAEALELAPLLLL